jgi:hypothetical protein
MNCIIVCRMLKSIDYPQVELPTPPPAPPLLGGEKNSLGELNLLAKQVKTPLPEGEGQGVGLVVQ